MPDARAHPALPRYLALVYALLIVYACLHPLAGWRSTGLPLLDFLSAPWPKYYRNDDLVLNILGYLPLGFALACALPTRLGRITTVALTTVCAFLLSFALETVQNFLPTRVSSNVDLATNTIGACVGALLGVRWGDKLFSEHGLLHRWRSERFIPGHTGDIGLILLGLWLLTQLIPDHVLFGSGDLRRILGLPTPLAFEPERFIVLESVMVALSVVGIGLFVRCMMQTVSAWPIVVLLTLGIGAKALAAASFSLPGGLVTWFTPGARNGLFYGLPLLALALLLPRLQQHALAGVALLAATVLINIVPQNPYLVVGQFLLRSGNFLNFHGLTQIVAAMLPFLALAYLSALGLWYGQHLAGSERS